MNKNIAFLLALLGLTAGSATDEGRDEGYDMALLVWEDYDAYCASNVDFESCVCDYAWNFGEDCDDMVEANYAFLESDSWRDKAFKRGVRFGVEQAVEDKENECLNDPDQCSDLGNAASSIIVMDACGLAAMRLESVYQQTCRAVAIGICEGNIASEMDSWGCGIDNATQLLSLMNDCESTIDCLLGDPNGYC